MKIEGGYRDLRSFHSNPRSILSSAGDIVGTEPGG